MIIDTEMKSSVHVQIFLQVVFFKEVCALGIILLSYLIIITIIS